MPLTYVAPSYLLPFYLAWQLEPESPNYHLNFSYQFENYADIEILLSQVQQLVNVRPYLRQTFALDGQRLIATIHETSELSVRSHTAKYVEFLQLEQKLIQDPFLLEDFPPLRLQIIHVIDKNIYIVLFTIHHIIMDGMTLNVFLDELNRLLADEKIIPESAEEYIAKIDAEPSLQDPATDENIRRVYADYVDRVNTIMAKLELPALAIEKNNYTHPVLHYTAVMPQELTEKLKNYAKQHSISIFNLFLVTYALFLAKLTNRECIVVRYPINLCKNQHINGCFVNIVALPLQLNSAYNYDDLVDYMSEMRSNLYILRRVQLDAQLKINNTPSFSSLTVANLVPLVIRGNVYESRSYSQLGNGFISLKYRQQDQQFYFVCDVLHEVYPENLSSSLILRFFNYLGKLLDNSKKKLNTVDLLFDFEKRRLLVDWNNTSVPYPQDKTLVDWFMEVVSSYANRIAIKNYKGTMTYRELNQSAESIAAELMNRGVQSEELVGILIDHQLEMITALFGVLKAGAAYIPIPHNTPTERIAAVIQDSSMRFLLTTPEWEAQVKTRNIEIINISLAACSKLTYYPPDILSKQLAYVIYTSGTTGKPKGIAIEHRSVVNYVNFLIRNNEINHKTIGSKYAGFGFDLSVSEIYPILLSGGTLCLIEEQSRQDCDAINAFFEKNSITYACLPTQMAEQFLQLKNMTLKNLGMGGERLIHFTPQRYRTVNMYGPTESTVQATYFVISEPTLHIPVGRPIDNMKCYILDNDDNLLPIGAVGELCISGVGLARYYLNLEDLTNQKFVKNKFEMHGKEQEKFKFMYKTGDLARWREDGNLEYRGRKDSQVKLGGCRIELEEIEHILTSHPAITKSKVILEKEGARAYLVAYYISRFPLKETEILDYLSQFLPSYMLPNIFLCVDSFSFTINGKIDCGALPRLNWNKLEVYAPPQTETQNRICEAFMNVLEVPHLGIHSDFFALGGNSMKVINLVGQLRQNFKIQVSDIYSHSTPERLAAKVRFLRNGLRNRLLQIKIQPIPTIYGIIPNNFSTMYKLNKYLSTISCQNQVYASKKLKTVLLTGVTGYLGCNLLAQLLHLTDYALILLIRARNTQDAWHRLHAKYKFHFDVSLTQAELDRISVVTADLEKPCLNMETDAYQVLAQQVDLVIHAAGLVKHYGSYETFYSANVQATRHMLEFTKITRAKDFHYISTSSVLLPASQSQTSFFTEDDGPEFLLRNPPSQVYIRTKLEGEALVVSYRQHGVSGTIYRVGNLAFMFGTGRLQENQEDNAFYCRIKTLLEWGIVSNIVGLCSISPVDLTAKAIVLLFDKKKVENTVLHVFNPHVYNIADILLAANSHMIRYVSPYEFIDTMIERLNGDESRFQVERFMLHQGWLELSSCLKRTAPILQERTQEMLRALNFSWIPISISVFQRYVHLVNLNNQKQELCQ